MSDLTGITMTPPMTGKRACMTYHGFYMQTACQTQVIDFYSVVMFGCNFGRLTV
jgi:hypothetical protein